MEPRGPCGIVAAEGFAKLGGMMTQEGLDAWEKAAACEAHAQNSKDGKLKDKFRKLRDSWIRIANDAQLGGGLAQNEDRLRKEERI